MKIAPFLIHLILFVMIFNALKITFFQRFSSKVNNIVKSNKRIPAISNFESFFFHLLLSPWLSSILCEWWVKLKSPEKPYCCLQNNKNHIMPILWCWKIFVFFISNDKTAKKRNKYRKKNKRSCFPFFIEPEHKSVIEIKQKMNIIN